MELTKQILQIASSRETPLLIIDRALIRAKLNAIALSLPSAAIYYAVKANSHPEVSRVVANLGHGFEVSSWPETEVLLELGVSPDRIISSNPIKPPQFLKKAYNAGVRVFAFDGLDELDKIAQFAPRSELYLRLEVDNEGSEWPLSKKYGVDEAQALSLLLRARALGLNVRGLTFHVGSQCLESGSWPRALALCKNLFEEARSIGLDLRSINLGGGLPAQHLKPAPSIAEIGRKIEAYVAENFPTRSGEPVSLAIEPGRGVVGDAAILVTSVIGRATRHNSGRYEHWLYIDAGVFNALMETIGGIRYDIKLDRPEDVETGKGVDRSVDRCIEWTVAGPSCDSVDVPFEKSLLPDLKVGERLYIMNAGAYTLSYASSFNGFPPPEVIVFDSALTQNAAEADSEGAMGRMADALSFVR